MKKFVENRLKYNNKSRCCYNQDAVLLFRLRNLGAFVFEFTLDAVIIKSAVVFAPIRYLVWNFKSNISNATIGHKSGSKVQRCLTLVL